MKLLTKDSNAKIKKTNKLLKKENIEFYNLTLTSKIITKKDGTKFNPCPNAELFGCREDCLRSAGMGIFSNVDEARTQKLEFFANEPENFMEVLTEECEKIVNNRIKKAKKNVRVRLNTISDIDWLKIPCIRNGKKYKNIFLAFPEINFYDYTKIASRFGKQLPTNYYLTMSDSKEPKAQRQVNYALKRGANLATVFVVKKGEDLPKTHRNLKVIDGDIDDNRIEDSKNIVVGLRLKGIEAIKNANNSNFAFSV